MLDCKIIIIHGINGSARTDFFPNLSELLKKDLLDFDISDFPGGLFNSFPKADKWIEKINGITSKIKKPIILVGYSLGTRAILLFLEKYQKHVEKVILFSSTPNDISVRNLKQGRARSFFEHKINLSEIKKLSKKFILVHSTDDPSTKYEWGVNLAKELNGELITFKNKGHFNKPENAEDIFKIIKKEL